MTIPNNIGNSPYEHILEESMFYKENELPIIPLCTHDHANMQAWHLARCSSPGKTPLIQWKDLRSAPTDAEFSRWIENFGDFNIGMKLGIGIIGVDVDGDYGREILERKCPDLPPTPTFDTPGGGYRYLFKQPDGVQVRKRSFTDPSRPHQELAIMGEGTQTVMPPSIHHTGGTYAWREGLAIWEIPLALLPDSILRLAADDTPIDASPSFDRAAGEAVLETLSMKCPHFKEDWETQRDCGVGEQEWFLCVALLTKAKQYDAVWAFSTASRKHNNWSAIRIRKLIDDAANSYGGMVRCSKFGCNTSCIQECFGLTEQHDTDISKSSPGSFIAKPVDNDKFSYLFNWKANDTRKMPSALSVAASSLFRKAHSEDES